MLDIGFYNMDCMDGMKEFPDKFFDLAIVDPPYFSGPELRGFYGRKVSTIGVKRYYHKSDAWVVPGKQYFEELFRVPRIKLYGDAITLNINLVLGESFGINAMIRVTFRIVKSHTAVFMIPSEFFGICGTGCFRERAFVKDLHSEETSQIMRKEYIQHKSLLHCMNG